MGGHGITHSMAAGVHSSGEGAGEQAGMARWEGARETQAHWGTLSTLGEALTQKQVEAAGLSLTVTWRLLSGSGGAARPDAQAEPTLATTPRGCPPPWPTHWPPMPAASPLPTWNRPRGR